MSGGGFEEEAEETVSINEYIQNMEDEELEADLVLGGDEGDECTYAKGYMKRQAIFSCLTCTPEGNAGVCTACCLSCHDGHEVLELWTKRNFRCDCGNSKFGVFSCKLFPSKDAENPENSYNHNFKGSYCSCNRPYPDPDAEEQAEMIQCCMCEDWFHGEHIGLKSSDKIPRDEEGEPLYEDFICNVCSPVCSFLMSYPETIWATGGQCVALTDAGKDKNVLEDIPSSCGSGKLEDGVCTPSSPGKDKGITNANPESTSCGSKSVIGESSEEKISSNDHPYVSCVLGVNKVPASPDSESKPFFLSKNWRDVLCRCEKCLNMYNQKHISYLLDKEDTIAEYEKRAKQKRVEKLQQQEGDALSFFNNLGHVTKMEILNGIQDFTEEFRGFLGSVDPSKTVTAADIHQLFENLKNKRRRM
ncbi:putative E3 ubiquitin-protein ligase UBR7 isoform X2 [Carica papaya]|uniref:putative E3 ubiquitin-protein ligase UBR7 isoform X2 n=1 Tax=Carica papaya TaxID=3649 RepID=UPI000B8CFD96|nr:putative E3 ubiquitin-protein ligase UBR7 isoform X2 [Carica papaya]